MWRAASVTCAIGATTLRETSRPSTTASATPPRQTSSEDQPQPREHGVGRLERAAELDGEPAARAGTVSTRTWVPSTSRVGEVGGATPAATSRARSSTGSVDGSVPITAQHVPPASMSWMYGVGPPAPRRQRRRSPDRRRGRGGGPPRKSSWSSSARSTSARSSPAHGDVGDERDERHRHRHRDGDRDGHAAAQRQRAHQSLQHVADAAHGVQEPRLAALLGLAAQVAHVDAERVRARAEVVAPHALEDLRARQHLARVLEEQRQQLELGARELELARAAPRLPGAAVERRGRRSAARWPSSASGASARRSSARRRALSSFSANGLTR